MKVAAQMSPTGRLADPGRAIGSSSVEFLEPAISIGLEYTAKGGEVALRVFSPAVWCEVVGRPRRSATTPGSIVADIDPDAAFLDAADHRIRSPA